MYITFKLKNLVLYLLCFSVFAFTMMAIPKRLPRPVPIPFETAPEVEPVQAVEDGLIKWVDFNVPHDLLKKAMEVDINSHEADADSDGEEYNWVELLAYLAAKNGNNFKNTKAKDIDALVKQLSEGETMENLTRDLKYYGYYVDAYSAILGSFLGRFSYQEQDAGGNVVWREKYGLKAYSPIAKGYYYSHYDDFGAGRSYGFDRKHLGNDLLGDIGTPIISIESGIVEQIGWNKYGGWRIGIRSLDHKRYYYYAHFRQNHPYPPGIEKGQIVKAGDVIGYLGRTGYSTTENVNNIDKNHLHWGLQLVFDESQKECDSEIWIDVYGITKLLQPNRSAVIRNDETKDYCRALDFDEPALHEEIKPLPEAAEQVNESTCEFE